RHPHQVDPRAEGEDPQAPQARPGLDQELLARQAALPGRLLAQDLALDFLHIAVAEGPDHFVARDLAGDLRRHADRGHLVGGTAGWLVLHAADLYAHAAHRPGARVLAAAAAFVRQPDDDRPVRRAVLFAPGPPPVWRGGD